MTSAATITIDGITYLVTVMGENIHGQGTVLALNKIGRNGKPTKAERTAILCSTGSVKVGPWL